MICLPVLDIRAGKAVHAVAGERSKYGPLQSLICPNADVVEAAQALAAQGFAELYVADLDAIEGAAKNWNVYASLARNYREVWLDAGWNSPAEIHALYKREETINPVIGLESLSSIGQLADLMQASEGRQIFSLDLMHGAPWTIHPELQRLQPMQMVEKYAECGGRSLILLDVAAVGVGKGPQTLALCQEIIRKHPSLEVTTGGGVRSLEDLRSIAHIGCFGALVGTALHQGAITPADCLALC